MDNVWTDVTMLKMVVTAVSNRIECGCPSLLFVEKVITTCNLEAFMPF